MLSPQDRLQNEAARKREEYARRRDEIRARRAQRRRERKLAGLLPARHAPASPRKVSARAKREKSEYDARRYQREKETARKQSDSLGGLAIIADNWFSELNYKVVAPSGRVAVERGRFDEPVTV